MTIAYINRIATAVPPYDIHAAFRDYARSRLRDNRHTSLFQRMADRAGIEHRYSFLSPNPVPDSAFLDAEGFYRRGCFPDTAARMRLFERYAPQLAATAVERLALGSERSRVTHLLITCCTGFSAPGLDLELIERCGLPTSVERTMIGFMGCYAAINALKLARHVVRSDRLARVLIVNLELCTLHFKETGDLDQLLSFLLWGDGCAACLVSSNPLGAALDGFRAVLIPDTRELITWTIREAGFDMVLSGKVPAVIHDALRAHQDDILGGARARAIDLWAVHPGGRTVLDAVERAFALAPSMLAASREILRCYGNMSSASVMFVLERLLQYGVRGSKGCAMSFGPGMIAESMLFRTTG
ncbi:MAG: type III polyketide synthase [Pseudolabrys sp.]|nr:type III polyketide synthase [Pseudolabrys sp.]